MKTYNVLYIEDSVGVGGSIVSLRYLLEWMNKQKYRPYTIVYHDNQARYLAEKCTGLKTIVARPRESLKSSRAGQAVLKSVAAILGKRATSALSLLYFLADFLTSILPYAWKLYRSVRMWNIDMVHLNTGVCLPGIVLAKFLRVPCIATQRGPEWLSPIILLFSKYVTFFMAISETTKNDLVALGVEAAKITVVNPPVDLHVFDCELDCSQQRKDSGLNGNESAFGLVGVLAEWKGQRTFLRAAARVLQIIPECRVFVIGDTPDNSSEYREELIALCEALKIREQVIFTGFREDIPALIQMLDVVVHASVTPEPFGKVIIEGMAMKKPVIASMAGGPTEIIEDGITGFLVAPGDEAQLAGRIIQVLQDKKLAGRIGEAARRSVEARFGIEKHVKNVEELYEGLLAAA
jgi:glycosyltransferase involved in cell wall biosynthesis